ncbi:threonine-phosphate decarboxylase [Pseudodonghicola flavimaris]|uniref:Aminotransferase n=1 Tax=Pseudodonghicola flavimaris TaxID=3050036 RepID=A0ABT7F6L5_9RHOB|nr:threonine-phosphate decarboxylase [Pseudodonghicola flavimaris]MDK3020252.1 pyridoxal phosphate-dependent class II aminotransferase [Pseudodonghicola flavimaris]
MSPCADTPADLGKTRDHGGGIDAAIARWGGTRADWLDLSTGINPQPYPLPDLVPEDWTALPDRAAFAALDQAARRLWQVPAAAGILAAPGASALIARIPALAPPGRVRIDAPTYNEHAAAFAAQGWQVTDRAPAEARVLVHPNNPDGRLWQAADADAPLSVIDESFCDVCPQQSLIQLAAQPGRVVLKSFGKFWGLAGLRLGFAIGRPETLAPLRDLIGPWAVSGPALRIGARALADTAWAGTTRTRLAQDARRLDALMTARGAEIAGGTDLFRLYTVDAARRWQAWLAEAHIWSRIFPYSDHYLRLGLPPAAGWARLEAAL